jgi:hypothetical protein
MTASGKPTSEATNKLAPKSMPWQTSEWQRLWLTTRGKPWRSLALVPAADFAPDTLMNFAIALARAGMIHIGIPIRAVNATRVTLARLMDFNEQLQRVVRYGDLAIVAVAPTADNAVAVQLAQTTDVAVVCVAMNTKADVAIQSIEAVGRTRFLGSIVIDDPALVKGTPAKASAKRAS